MKSIGLNLSKIALCLFMGLGIFFFSCSGEDGKDGINGEMGIQGEQGEQGEQGDDGQDGNANVIVSDWMLITWTEINQLVPPTLGSMYIDEIHGINDLSAFMETGGIVLFYLKRDLGIGYLSVMLPYEEGLNRISADVAISTDPNYSLAGLIIRGQSNDVTHLENNDDYMIRYILVPANVVDTSGISNKIPENFDEAATLLGFEQ